MIYLNRKSILLWITLGFCCVFPLEGKKQSSIKPESLIEQLGHRDWRVRERAYRILRSDTRPETVRLLEQAQNSPDAEIRYRVRTLLIVKQYYLPEGKELDLIPLITAFRETGERNADKQASIIQAIVSEAGADAVPLLLVMLGKASPELKKRISVILRDRIKEWGDRIMAGFKELRPDDARNLGDYPASVYLYMKQYESCERFLYHAVPYLDFEDIFRVFYSLTRVHDTGRYTPVMFERIIDALFEKYADYFYSEAFSEEKAVDLGTKIRAVSHEYNSHVYRKTLFVLAELGEKNAFILLIGPAFRKRDYGEIKRICAVIRPGTRKARYYISYINHMISSDPDRKQKISGLLNMFPRDEDVHLHTARFLSNLGKDIYAEKEFKRVIEIKPHGSFYDFQACYRLGKDYYMRREFRQAEQIFKQAYETGVKLHKELDRTKQYKMLLQIGLDIEDARYYTEFCKIQILMDEGKYDAALDILKPLDIKLKYDREVGFKSLEYEIILGRLLMLAGREKEKNERVNNAYTYYVKQKEKYNIDRGVAHWHNNIAWYLIRTGSKPDTALEYSKKSLELEPDTAIYLDTLAECYYVRGDTEKAIELIERAIDRYESDSSLIYFKKQLKRFKKQ